MPEKLKTLKKIAFWKVLLWALLILFASIMPGKTDAEPPLFTIAHSDKIAHAFAYFVLTLFLVEYFVLRHKLSVFRRSLFALVSAFAYGGLMEVLQGVFFVWRTADWADFAANAAGSLAGLVLAGFYLKILGKIPFPGASRRANKPVKNRR